MLDRVEASTAAAAATFRTRPQRILDEECEAASINLNQLRSDLRLAHIVEARRRAARRLRGELGLSYPHIGQLLDRDHTTIIALVDDAFRVRKEKRRVAERKKQASPWETKQGGNRWRGRIPIPPHGHPFVRQLIQHANEQQTTLTEIAQRAGIRRLTLSDWRYNRLPRVDLLEAALNVLDLELVIRPRDEPEAGR
jgi:hypothetical protein